MMNWKRKVVTVLVCFLLLMQILPAASVSAADNAAASNNAYAWLKAQQDLTAGLALDGLVDSFDDWWNATDRRQIVYTYDQAVAAIAFMLKGDRTRAEKVLNKMVAIQDPDGSWINSYWWNGYGEEIRKHVGPVAWMVMAFMTHEKLYGGTTYQASAKKALDWAITFQKPNGAIAGGRTTWDLNGAWSDEVWSSTEHNEDMYQILKYYAGKFADRTTAYNNAATGVKSFLDNVVWDSANNRWRGGWKNNTNLIDPAVPMDVNPWGVLALGLSGTRNYQASLSYIENANGSGTVDSPKYVHSLTYDGSGALLTAYDFDWQYDCAAGTDQNGNPIGNKCADIWFEGSAFMSLAYYMQGNQAKADAIINEIVKKQGTSGSLLGGVPYSLKGSNNSYWRMAMENCVSSTGWLIIAAHRFNPFTGTYLTGGGVGGDTTSPSVPANLTSPSKTSTSVSLSWTASTDNVAVTGYDILRNGSVVGSSTGTTYTDTGLSANTAYTFAVKAKDAAGNASAASSSISVTTSSSSPANSPTLYVRDGASSSVTGTLSTTAGSSANTDAIAAAGGSNWDGTVHTPTSYVLSGVSGTYSGGATAFNLFVDSSSSVGNAVQVRISYDFTGDGTYDRLETYNYFATNDTPGTEDYNQSKGVRSSSGTFANLSNGKVRVEIWSAIGNGSSSVRTDATSAQGSQSKIVIPFS
ncbi:fibronectin type III domain-containing protein [Paenibacillus aurantiacus]|uniref:Fibronectin type III domain-containing protein n=1 Tax=Paenibacillus aurantiacus TaxID=1936118 RepID=A0ABV5KXS8_9BACL